MKQILQFSNAFRFPALIARSPYPHVPRFNIPPHIICLRLSTLAPLRCRPLLLLHVSSHPNRARETQRDDFQSAREVHHANSPNPAAAIRCQVAYRTRSCIRDGTSLPPLRTDPPKESGINARHALTLAFFRAALSAADDGSALRFSADAIADVSCCWSCKVT